MEIKEKTATEENKVAQVANGYDAAKKDGQVPTDQNAIDKIFESLGLLDRMTNANEALHTTQTGYGKELVPVNVLSDEVLDMTINEAPLLSFLPGDHGRNMNATEKVPIIGEPGYFAGNSEWDGSATTLAVGTHKTPTAEVTITQVPLIMSIPISKRLLNYSVVDLESHIKTAIAKAAARTITAMIINADAETGATGNVNSDDQAPATTYGATHYSLQTDHGLRELAINGTSLTVNVGTLARADFTSLENILGDLYGEECLWITNRKGYNTISALDDFSDASKRGESSTINGNAVGNIDGADVFVTREMGLTKADGKLSATASNNVKGQLGLLWTPAVQYGFGQPLEIDVVKIPGKGIQIVATMEFGFTIVQLKAGLTDSSVALGINITV